MVPWGGGIQSGGKMTPGGGMLPAAAMSGGGAATIGANRDAISTRIFCSKATSRPIGIQPSVGCVPVTGST